MTNFDVRLRHIEAASGGPAAIRYVWAGGPDGGERAIADLLASGFTGEIRKLRWLGPPVDLKPLLTHPVSANGSGDDF